MSAQNLVPNYNFQSGNTPNCLYGGETHADADIFDADIDDWKNARKAIYWIDCHVFQLCIPSCDWFDSNCSCHKPIPSIPDNRFIRIYGTGTSHNYHEGVIVELDDYLENGKTYILRMKLAADDVDAVVTVHMTSNGGTYTSSNDYWDDSPEKMTWCGGKSGGFPSPVTCPDDTDCTCYPWIINENYITITKDNLKYLVILAHDNTIFVDDVELYKQCEDILRFENKEYNVFYPTFEADYKIYAGYNVGANTANGNVVVKDGATVRYKAGHSVRLKHGFRTEGGYFHAYNAPCDVSSSLNLYSQNPVNSYSDFSDNSVKIFPNPAKNKFSLEFNNPPGENVNVRIYDVSGNEIYNNSFPYIIYKININISDFEPGMYLVKINTKSNEFVEKLMIN